MLELSLRRVTKIVNKVDARVRELNREATQNANYSAFIHDEDDFIIAQLNESERKWSEAMIAMERLVDVRIVLRQLVGAANQSSGVNDLVTELRGIENKLSIVTQMRSRVDKEARLDEVQLVRRLVAYRKKGEKAQVDVSYGSYRGDSDDNVSFKALGEKYIELLEIQEKGFKNRVEQISDQLERINTNVTVEIPDEIQKALQELEIIE